MFVFLNWNSRKHRWWVGVAFVLAFSWSQNGVASEKVLVIGVEDLDYLPQYTYSKTGEYQGFARVLLDQFAKKHDYRFVYEALPLMRLFRNFFDRQEIDLKFPDNPYWQSEMRTKTKVYYSKPVVEYVDGVMVLPKNKGKGRGDLKSLGTIFGFTPIEYLPEIKSGAIVLSEIGDLQRLLQLTLRERTHGTYISVAVANYQLENVLKKPEALVFDSTLPHTRSFYHLSTLKHPQVVEEFDRFLIENAEMIRQLKLQHGVENGIH